MKRNKIKIAVVGAGRIAHSLAPALINGGYNLACIVSRKISSAKNLAQACGVVNYSRELDSLAVCDVVFLAVPDSALTGIAEKISRSLTGLRGKLFIHLSGSSDLSVLSPLVKKGASAASMHLMQTFPARIETSLQNIPVLIDCRKSDERLLNSLAVNLGLRKVKIPPEYRTDYHLGGVFVSNFMIANFYAAEMMIEKFGQSNGNFSGDLFIPIAKNTLANIENGSLINSLSGPIIRGDVETIKAHISSLKNNAKKRSVNLFLFFYLSGALMLLNLIKQRKKSLSKNQSLIGNILLRELNKSRRQI